MLAPLININVTRLRFVDHMVKFYIVKRYSVNCLTA